MQPTSKQEDTKKPQLKQLQTSEGELDKQILSNLSSNDLRNKMTQGGAGIKNTSFQNYSILAQETQLGYSNPSHSRRTSAILLSDVPQNYINLTDNLSYQSTNRSMSGNNPSIVNNPSKYDQTYATTSNNNINHINSNANPIPNKSNTSSVHKSNQQQGQLQKEVGYSVQTQNMGYGSNQNSSSNLQYNNNQYTLHTNQTSTLPAPSNANSYQQKPVSSSNNTTTTSNNNKDITNNSQVQFNHNLNTKISPPTNNESKIQYNTLNPTTFTTAPQISQPGQSLSSHPTHRDQDIHYLQDYNPKSLIEKRRKSHSITNNIINSNSHNLKQAAISSNLTSTHSVHQPMVVSSNSQINSHQISTNSIMSQNVSHNNSQIICTGSSNNQYNSNKSPLNSSSSNINNPINPFSSNTLNTITNTASNPLNKSNLSNVSNQNTSTGVINHNTSSNTISTAVNSIQNYAINNPNFSTTSNAINKGYNSGSKQSNNNNYSYPNQQNSNNNLSNISDSSKITPGQNPTTSGSSQKPVNLTFADQLKIEKQKKLNDNNNFNTLNGAMNSERNNNNKQGNVSITANNSYSYWSNNSNNTSAICTPYAVSNVSDILPKNIGSNNNLNSNNNHISEGTSYSVKNSNPSSLQNTYAKSKESYQSSNQCLDILTNPNSSRVQGTNLNLITNNLEPLSAEQQAINALLQQVKYLPPQGTSNESKYFTLQYSKLNKFDSDILLPTSAPAQIINPAFNDPIQTLHDQLPNLTTNFSNISNISNKKSSPANNNDLQNVNQLKQTAKPCIATTKNIDIGDSLQQPKSAKGDYEFSQQINKEKYQLPISSRQPTTNSISNNNHGYNIQSSIAEYKKELMNELASQTKNPVVSQSNLSNPPNHISNKPSISNNNNNNNINRISKVDSLTSNNLPSYLAQDCQINYQIDQQQKQQQVSTTINDKIQQDTLANKNLDMQNLKQIQQKQPNQPVKWYLHDSQAQFEEEEDRKRSKNLDGLKQKNEKVEKPSILLQNIQSKIAESNSIQQQILNSESSSLTQISTYREDHSKCLQNISYVNNYTNIDAVNTTNNNSKEYVVPNYSSLQAQKFKKEPIIHETHFNQPYQIGSTVETINKGISNQPNKGFNNIEIKDSYLMDFEDLAEYFSQNNGVKPSNNTPEIENGKLLVVQQNIETTEFNNLCQSVESLPLHSLNTNPFINIQNQEEELFTNKNATQIKNGDGFDKKKKHTASPDIQTKYYEDFNNSNMNSIDNLYKFNELPSNRDQLGDLNDLTSGIEFSSCSNLYLNNKVKNNLKSLNDWEGLCQIEEGEYDLKADQSDEDNQDNSKFSLNAIGEDLEDQLDSSQKQNKILENEEAQENDKGMNLGVEEDESVDDAQLLCDEDDLHEAMKSNISNILNDIDNDDPNQAFYQNNYYDQACFNVESYSNYKNYNQSYSNAPSNQKPDFDHHFTNTFVAPFGFGESATGQNLHSNFNKLNSKQSESKSSLQVNSQNKPNQESQRQVNHNHNKKSQKDNFKENQISKDELLIDDEVKQSSQDLNKRTSTNKLQTDKSTINSHRTKELTEKQKKEEQLAKLKQELEEFDKTQSQFPIFGGDHLTYLLNREADYQPNPFYMKSQVAFNPTMRAILLDWMMEVSEEFGLKRETYYIAINIVDRMFSFKNNLQIKEFQLIGVTSLHMASKLEEIYPKRVEDFITSTDNGYTASMINKTEQDILWQLNFMVNPPTVSFWGNWFMSQWDIFIQTSEKAQNSSLVLQYYTENSTFIQFKQANSKSYDLFREYMQIVDFTILNLETLQIKSTTLHCSIMYIVLGKAFGIFTEETIFNEIAEGYIFGESFAEFNDLYNAFTGVSYGMTIDSIVQFIQYASQFFILPVTNTMPLFVSQNKQPLQGNYEDFLQYQTHNKQQIAMFKQLKK